MKLKCPYCGYKESKVVDSRPADEGNSIRRRRECLACEKRFTTYETMESLPMVVIKKDGSRQSYDRNKVLGSMLRACEKRTVPLAKLEQMTDELDYGTKGESADDILIPVYEVYDALFSNNVLDVSRIFGENPPEDASANELKIYQKYQNIVEHLIK